MKKYFFIALTLFLTTVVLPNMTLAHAVVTPSQTAVAQSQIFSVGVPTEKDNPTVSVRLVLPDGLTGVTPNVKNGWKITEKMTGSGEDALVSEITWSGGSIPVNQRDEFSFKAKVPSTVTTLTWKVYQTYQNGEVVSWDKEGSDDSESETSGPASHTQVVNDLATPTPSASPYSNSVGANTNLLSLLSLVISVAVAYKVFFAGK